MWNCGGRRTMPPVWTPASVPVFFFYNRGTTTLSVRVNRGEATTETFEPIDDLQEMTVEGNIGSVRWTVESADSTLFYGLAMDGTSGIVLDNFSLRGSSGLSLRSVPVWMMREFNEQRPYDLIILQYGLNVATERGRNYDKYIAGMQTTVQHLKEVPFRKHATPHSQRWASRTIRPKRGAAYHAWHQESGSLSAESGSG